MMGRILKRQRLGKEEGHFREGIAETKNGSMGTFSEYLKKQISR